MRAEGHGLDYFFCIQKPECPLCGGHSHDRIAFRLFYFLGSLYKNERNMDN